MNEFKWNTHKYMHTNASTGKCVIGDKRTSTELYRDRKYTKRIRYTQCTYMYFVYEQAKESETVTSERNKEEEEVAAATAQVRLKKVYHTTFL